MTVQPRSLPVLSHTNMSIMNYDPNLTNSGRMAQQEVKLTFAIWEYRREMIVPVGGNTNGMSVLRAAVSFAFDKLPTEQYGKNEIAYIELVRARDGAEMRCDDEDDEGEDWLENMCIAAEIISIKPKPDEDEQDAATMKAREQEPND